MNYNNDALHIVAFITDFGIKDSYVCEMYSSVLRECPRARLMDITHQIPRGNIKAASYLVWRASKFLPEGSVIVVIVDPGVGSNRQMVIINAQNRFFVGPDNGLFSRILDPNESCKVRIIDWNDTRSEHKSRTFHGRDIFAPVAGRLAAGYKFDEIGNSGKLLNTAPSNAPRICEGFIEGEIVYIDHFGNAATDLPNTQSGLVELDSRRLLRNAETYTTGPTGECFWLAGSDGNIEIAANGGDAAKSLRLSIGDRVRFIKKHG